MAAVLPQAPRTQTLHITSVPIRVLTRFLQTKLSQTHTDLPTQHPKTSPKIPASHIVDDAPPFLGNVPTKEHCWAVPFRYVQQCHEAPRDRFLRPFFKEVEE